nr:hypothetical protein [Paracoccus aeridis]
MTKRLEMLRAGAAASGFTIDFLEALTQGLSRQATLKVIGNASAMPSYMKSSDNPYVRRSARAPSMEIRDLPVSQLDS